MTFLAKARLKPIRLVFERSEERSRNAVAEGHSLEGQYSPKNFGYNPTP